MSEIDISIVTPVYNTARYLGTLYERVLHALKEQGISFEIIYVNDCSPDDAIDVIDRLSREHKNVRQLHLTENVGQHRAILAGMSIAKGSYTVVMDSDLQDVPELIPQLYAQHLNTQFATFVLREGAYESLVRRQFSFIIKGTIQRFTGLHRKAGTYFIIDTTLAHRLAKLTIRNPFVTVMVAMAVQEINYLPYTREKRLKGVTSYTVSKLIRATLSAFQCIYTCRRQLKQNR
jgi:glycosyltransferase involved in cell wall biosynthesis